MTLVEITIGALLGSILLAVVGSFLFNALNAGAYVDGHSATMNNTRNAMQSIEKETRGAESLRWCEPIGYCVEVGGMTPSGDYQTVRYAKTGTDLVRHVYDGATETWSDGVPLIERVVNDGSTPVFSCDTQSTLLRVNVDLRIEPTPRSGPNLQATTSIRPRNFPSAAICP